MSTIKSSAENLTLNADGANNDVIIQSNASTKVTVDGATGGVGIGVTPETWQSTYKMVDVNASASFGGHSSYFTYMGNNWYVDASGNHKYKNTSFATRYYQDSSGKHHFQTAPSGTADAGVTLTTKATIDTDGLKFNGDTAAANALDDYEEGTWTPACSRATVSTVERARYTKIGRLVHVFAYFQLAADGTGHNISFTGLPFTVASEIYETGITQFSNNSVSRGILARTGGNSTTINLYYTDGTQAEVPTDSVDGGHVMISLTYNV